LHHIILGINIYKTGFFIFVIFYNFQRAFIQNIKYFATFFSGGNFFIFYFMMIAARCSAGLRSSSIQQVYQ